MVSVVVFIHPNHTVAPAETTAQAMAVSLSLAVDNLHYHHRQPTPVDMGVGLPHQPLSLPGRIDREILYVY